MIRRRVAAVVLAIFVTLLAMEGLEDALKGAALSPARSLTLKDILGAAEPSLENFDYREAANRNSYLAVTSDIAKNGDSLRRTVALRRTAEEALFPDEPPLIYLRHRALLI